MGLTKPRASQIFDIDYKQATRVITVSNVNLTGGAPASVDGVSLSTGDRVLVTAQTTGSENGIYKVSVLGVGSDGTWIRASDSDQDGEIQAGMIVMVTEGTTYADTQWKLTTNNPIDIGTTALTFEPNSGGSSYGNANVATYLSSGTVSTDILTTAAISATGNVTGGNIVTLGIVSSAGVSSAGALLPTANVTYDLGSTSLRWNDLWLSNSSIHLGSITVGATETGLTVNSAPVVTETGTGIDLTGNVAGGNILTSGLISATGNISGGNVLTTGNISVTGDVTAANFNTTSDARIKTNVEPIPNAIDIVNRLEGVFFDKNGEPDLGLIAQSVEVVIPRATKTLNDEIQTKTVNYGGLVGLLIEAIKSNKREIEELKSQIKRLES